MPAGFKHVAILGTGLIGGSFGLALRKLRPRPRVVGWDKPDVLKRARERGAIDRGETDLARAVRGADLVYIALPVGAVLEHLPEIARAASPRALVTDTASSKRAICEQAAACFTVSALFLGGHPMAGKEISGVAAAEAKLFDGARYALIRASAGAVAADSSAENLENDSRVRAFVALLDKLGAQTLWLDAASHDRAAAFVSHLPQLLSVALAGVVRDQTDQTGLPLILAGRGLISCSPTATISIVRSTACRRPLRICARCCAAASSKTSLQPPASSTRFSAIRSKLLVCKGTTLPPGRVSRAVDAAKFRRL